MKNDEYPVRIIDNPSTKETLDQFRAMEKFSSVFSWIPFARHLFPEVHETLAGIARLKGKLDVLYIPDRFNSRFSGRGWIAYDSMRLETMRLAIEVAETDGLDAAEVYLANYYDQETLRSGILRFQGSRDFRRRVRLVELARDDYLAERYHACVPLLLCLLDGLVNDVSKHVGFFAEGVDMTAWDSIAAHSTGLQAVVKLMTTHRSRTSENPIQVPYRHGILHGRELAFDNKIVAAKCWAVLFATRDWAGVIESRGKGPSPPKAQKSWREVLSQIQENSEFQRKLDAWRPRSAGELVHLPSSLKLDSLHKETPEYAVEEFVENWIAGRWGPLAQALIYYTHDSLGKKASQAKEDFGRRVPSKFRIVSVEDRTPALSDVSIELSFEREAGLVQVPVEVRTIFQSHDGELVVRGEAGGSWRLHRKSFTAIIYARDVDG